MHIVLVGNLTNGYHAVGPFEDYAGALDWAERFVVGTNWFIFAVYPADTENYA